MDFFKQITHDYLVLFAMVNAIGNLPVFADLTSGMDKPTRNRTFHIAALVGGAIVVSFAFFGDFMIRSVFEVSTSSFKIAGGMLVFWVAARGVVLGPHQHVRRSDHYENVAIFPMGFPFLAGPGTIITTILLFQSGGSLVTASAAVLVYLTVIPILYIAPFVERLIGRVGVLLITRILYIFICAKAISFIIEGLRLSLKIKI